MNAAAAPQRLHPVVWVAAVAVTVFSLVGIGAITGLIPHASSTAPALAEAPAPPAASPTAPPRTAPTPSAATTDATSAPAKAKPVVAKSLAPKPVARLVDGAPAATGPAAAPGMVAEAPREVAPAPLVVARAPAPCADCGVVEGVREVKDKGQGSGLGAVAGGVVGGLLGSQVGKGRGNTLATVAGVVGGAVAGHQVEKTVKSATRYEVSVRMDDGTLRVVTQAEPPAWRNGDPVRIANGVLIAD